MQNPPRSQRVKGAIQCKRVSVLVFFFLMLPALMEIKATELSSGSLLKTQVFVLSLPFTTFSLRNQLKHFVVLEQTFSIW